MEILFAFQLPILTVMPDVTLRRWGFALLFLCYQCGTDVTAALSRRQLGEASHYRRAANPTGAALCSHSANVTHRVNKQCVVTPNAGLGGSYRRMLGSANSVSFCASFFLL